MPALITTTLASLKYAVVLYTELINMDPVLHLHVGENSEIVFPSFLVFLLTNCSKGTIAASSRVLQRGFTSHFDFHCPSVKS